MVPAALHQQIEERGYAVLPGVFPADDATDLLHGLTAALNAPGAAASALRSQDGAVYGARNVLSL